MKKKAFFEFLSGKKFKFVIETSIFRMGAF